MAKPESEPNNRLVENNQQTSDNIGLFKERSWGHRFLQQQLELTRLVRLEER